MFLVLKTSQDFTIATKTALKNGNSLSFTAGLLNDECTESQAMVCVDNTPPVYYGINLATAAKIGSGVTVSNEVTKSTCETAKVEASQW